MMALVEKRISSGPTEVVIGGTLETNLTIEELEEQAKKLGFKILWTTPEFMPIKEGG